MLAKANIYVRASNATISLRRHFRSAGEGEGGEGEGEGGGKGDILVMI